MNQNIMDISQVDIKRLIRDMGEKEETSLLKQIIQNNVMLLNLQRQILELQVVKDQKRKRQQEQKQRKREYDERQEKEEQKIRKEMEEEEKRKRIDVKWKRVEEMRVREEGRVEKKWR